MWQSIVDTISMWFSGVVDAIWDPLYLWYFWGFVALVGALFVGFFLPQSFRAWLGGALLLVAAYIAGGRQMHQSMQAKLDEAKKKAKESAPVQHQQQTWTPWF